MKTPLTKTQYGLYAECSQHPGKPCYNIPYLYTLDGKLDADKLRKAIEAAVIAHPTLFTRVELSDDGEPVQVVGDQPASFSLEMEETTDIEAVAASFVQPFDLLKDRLFRIRLLHDKEHYYILQDIHHIISDGSSRKVLLAEIEKAYADGRLEVAGERILAQTAEEEAKASDEVKAADKTWYTEQFDCSDCYSPLLPDIDEEDRKVCNEKVNEEGLLTRPMSVSPADVEAFCKANGVYKSTLFTAVYGFLLAKYNNEQQALFDSIYNGRNAENAHAVGMFVRTFPVYAKWESETTVQEFLQAVQEQMSGCRTHTSYAYSDVVTDLGLQSATMFAWHGTLFDSLQFAGLPMQSQRLNNNTREGALYVKAYERNGQYFVEAEYAADAYSETIISQLLESYEAVLTAMPGKQYLREITITTPAQIGILDSFNNSDVEYDATQTIVSLFRRQAKATPDNIAVVYKDHRYTYVEVDGMSDRIAAYIVSKGLGRGDVVSVLIPRCEWMAIASLGVLKAGCAYQPLDPSYPKERLNFMMQDAAAKLLIVDEELRPIIDEYRGEVLLTKDLNDLGDSKDCKDLLDHAPKPEDLFILLYTSGSTGVPKGCQLTHGNLVCFCHWYQRRYQLRPEHNHSAYASYGFDCCMMDMYPSLTCGATVHIIGDDIRLNLIEVGDYFNREHITHCFMTTQVGYQFATSIENHSLLYLSAGGEKMASLTPPSNYTLMNGYGPTECTIFTTVYPVLTKKKDIPIGKPLDNVYLYVVDPQGNRLPVGALGELWVAGPQVAKGYLNRPEKTAEVFVQNPFVGSGDKYARAYRTGDIVRYLPDGNIQFVGRRDGQVKIRGFRIELKEVEAVIREFAGIKDVTVQAFDEEGGGKFIAAYIVSDSQIDIEALNSFILDRKPPYMVPAVTMQIESIPLNQNQKVNRRALPSPVESRKATLKEECAAPLNVLEQELKEIIAGVVGNSDLGITTMLSYVGLTSITSIKLAIQIHKRFGVLLDSKALVKGGSIQGIENEILEAMLGGNHSDEIPETRNTETEPAAAVPLSYAQTGVYFDCLKNPGTTIYNIPMKVAFARDTDTQALANTVEQVVTQHPEMNVHFETKDGEPVQVADNVELKVERLEMTEAELETYKHTFVRPLDLNKGPLYEFAIVTTDKAVYLLMDVHHIIFDGGSLDLFLRQLCELMNGETLEREELTYAAYVQAQKAAEGGDAYNAAREFFKTQLSAVEAATEVQPDLANPVNGTLSKAMAAFDIEAVNTFCREHRLTGAHLTLAATYYALSRFANNEQVCITTVSGGRSNIAIRNTVGMFVNTMAIAANTGGEQTVSAFLQKVSEDFNRTLEHENYPFAQVAADFGLSAQIQFVYQLGVMNPYVCRGSELELESLELQVPKFPITIFVREHKGQAEIDVEYDNGKYSEPFIQRLADAVVTTLQRMIANPDARLSSISIVSDKEREHLIRLGQGKDIDVDLSRTFANLFTEQAARTPDAPAVVDRDSQLTYGEMDRYSNALARQLIEFGVQPDDFVCVMLDRFKEFPLAVLSIHKAGAAYTPLDFEYPNERLSYMLENSESKVLITSHDVLEAKLAEGDFSTAAARTFFIDDFMDKIVKSQSSKSQSEAPIDLSTPDGLAYMIYTSGSTGKPKGAMLHQAGLRNFIAVVIDMEKLTANDRISGHRSFSFDAHIEDMYPVLTLGGSFHIMPTEIRKDLGAIRQFLIDHRITGGGYSTAMTCLLLNTFDDLPIRFTTGGGEKMSGVYSDHIEIINVYGPTECTDDTSYYAIKPGRQIENIPIGESVANNWNFIVDSAGNLVPQGVAGELCFAGIQVGRGYWRLPERTAKSFVDCPFVKEDRWGRPVRMYHTGDLCRWNADGQIEYLGRIDTQVKLRGFRIELGEIETKALNIEGIRQAAAEVRKVQGNEHLVLYYTLNEGASVTEEAIHQALAGSSLAEYMVPDAYMQMDVMPMTPNGKINRKVLPAPELKRNTDFVAPETDNEKLFCDIFAAVLDLPEVGALDNFFEIGGTSINAIKVIVEASKRDVQIVFTDVFNLKTPRALAAYVDGGNAVQAGVSKSADAETPKTQLVDNAQYEAYMPVLEANCLNSFRMGERQPVGDVLLTGATGYLGIHVLNELLTNYEGHILCPLRAKAGEEPMNRLKTLYYYYFGRTEAFAEFDKRVTVFPAEVTQPDALTDITTKGLTVINCVANVKHFSAGNDIEMVNIESVRHLITFCIRTQSRLIHVSTNSIAGLSVDGVPGPEIKLTEQRFNIGQNIDANKYVYSKYKAEELVLEAIAHHGLNAKIMRVGNLSAREKDGEFQINFNTNNFLAKLRAYVVIGMVPYDALDQRFEFSPIDLVARAILLLSTTPKECIVFHPNNVHRQPLADILDGFAEAGIRLPRVEPEEFRQALNKMMDNPDLVTLLRPLMAYQSGGGHQTRWIESTNDYTTQVLYRLGFQWPLTAADYVHRFVDTIVGFGFFEV